MDLRAAADEDVAAAAADGDGLFDLGFAVDAAAPGGAKIFGQLGRVGQDQVPDIVPRRQLGIRQGEILLGRRQQRVEGIGSQFCEVFADDPRCQHFAVGIEEDPAGAFVEFGQAVGFDAGVDHQKVRAGKALRGSLTGQPSCRADFGQVRRQEAGHFRRAEPDRRAFHRATSCRSAVPRSAGKAPRDRSSAAGAWDDRPRSAAC